MRREKRNRQLVILGVLMFILLTTAVGITRIWLPKLENEKRAIRKLVSISAVNENEYIETDVLKEKDFTVTAAYNDGSKEKLGEKEFSLSRYDLENIGGVTYVEITLNSDASIRCSTIVRTKREEVESYYIGFPEKTNVKVTYYSNGELVFEGNGDTMQYKDGYFPWMRSDEYRSREIRAITFSDGFAPTSMNNWFANLKGLTYVDQIPASVTSMERCFYGCESLIEAPEWKQCELLLDINECYMNCYTLQNVPGIPKAVKLASAAFKNCTGLRTAPDMEDAEALVRATEMFMNCQSLINTGMPKNVKNIDSMFEDCINLKEMPVIPRTVTTMRNTFSGDFSLTRMTNIPKKVKDISNCFAGCSHIEGTLKIDANPEVFSGFMSKAAMATFVDFVGKSKKLYEIARSTGLTYITVKGKDIWTKSINKKSKSGH